MIWDHHTYGCHSIGGSEVSPNFMGFCPLPVSWPTVMTGGCSFPFHPVVFKGPSSDQQEHVACWSDGGPFNSCNRGGRGLATSSRKEADTSAWLNCKRQICFLELGTGSAHLKHFKGKVPFKVFCKQELLAHSTGLRPWHDDVASAWCHHIMQMPPPGIPLLWEHRTWEP